MLSNINIKFSPCIWSKCYKQNDKFDNFKKQWTEKLNVPPV